MKIVKIIDTNNLEKERVLFQVDSNEDLDFYMLFNSEKTSEGKVKRRPKNVFWFPARQLKVGDSVVLYTKSGNTSQVTNSDGTTTYFFYWNLPATIWNEETTPVLFTLESWKSI